MAVPTRAPETRLAASPADCSAAADFPKMFRLVVEGEEAIARVVPLAAVGAGNEAADVHSAAVVIFGNGKAGAATTGDEEHAEVFLVCCLVLGSAVVHQLLAFSLSAFDRCQRALLPPVRLQNLLPQAQRFGRDLDELIVGDEFDGLLEIEIAVRHQPDRLIGS
jgi:hypothetical protein